MQLILQTNIIRKPKMLYFCKGNPIGVYEAKPGRRDKKLELDGNGKIREAKQ